jgi:hypothetical protein
VRRCRFICWHFCICLTGKYFIKTICFKVNNSFLFLVSWKYVEFFNSYNFLDPSVARSFHSLITWVHFWHLSYNMQWQAFIWQQQTRLTLIFVSNSFVFRHLGMKSCARTPRSLLLYKIISARTTVKDHLGTYYCTRTYRNILPYKIIFTLWGNNNIVWVCSSCHWMRRKSDNRSVLYKWNSVSLTNCCLGKSNKKVL